MRLTSTKNGEVVVINEMMLSKISNLLAESGQPNFIPLSVSLVIRTSILEIKNAKSAKNLNTLHANGRVKLTAAEVISLYSDAPTAYRQIVTTDPTKLSQIMMKAMSIESVRGAIMNGTQRITPRMIGPTRSFRIMILGTGPSKKN